MTDYPHFMLSSSTYPRFLMSTTPLSRFELDPIDIPPPENKESREIKDEKEEEDYEELSYYDIFRDKLQEMKIEWPLTSVDEYEIEKKCKTGDPDIQLIKMAFHNGDEDVKKAMLIIADKINYVL